MAGGSPWYPSGRASTRSLPIQCCPSKPGDIALRDGSSGLNIIREAGKARDSIGDVVDEATQRRFEVKPK